MFIIIQNDLDGKDSRVEGPFAARVQKVQRVQRVQRVVVAAPPQILKRGAASPQVV